MCGISGAIDFGRATPPDRLEAIGARMAETLRHRGPDDTGNWVDADAGIAFGHTRLAIIDLSPDGRQPMVSADGRWVLVFNGEIYNFADLRSRLTSAGVAFRSDCDTEVLLEAVAAWGVDTALERLNGMFAFAIWDRERRELTLARDRPGEKPLYYGWMNGHLLFGSETKALRAHPAFDAALDRDALALYLRHNYIPAPRSVFRHVRKLPPATSVTIPAQQPDTRPDPRPYWSARAVALGGLADPLDVDRHAAADLVETQLAESVAMRMVADVPLGAFLSGGIDSSLVVALMQQASERPVRTFTIGFHEAGYDEAPHAKAVAHHLGTDHTELYVTPDEARAVIPRLPEIYDEPFADSSQIPTFLVSQLTRQHVTVALSGDGGDELFGGYDRYGLHRELLGRVERWPAAGRRAAAGALRAVRPATWDRVFDAVEPLLPERLRVTHPGDKLHKLARVLDADGQDAAYLQLVSHWDTPDEVVIGAHEPGTALTDPAITAAFADPTDRSMYLDTVTYLPDDILTKVDRAAMAVSLEVRVPMLDHRLVELAWRLPQTHRFAGGDGKRVLKDVLGRHLPPSIFERPKMGFGVPIGEWLRGPLRDWAEDLLAADRLRREGVFRPEPIRTAWDEHVRGERDWKYHLWDVLMFQAWWQHVRDAPR